MESSRSRTSIRSHGRIRGGAGRLAGLAGSLIAVLAAVGLATTLGAAGQHPLEPHRHEEARALQNPVPSDEASLVAGQHLYARFCRGCHGAVGRGDGGMSPMGGTPSSLVEPTLLHGASDGEIFIVIRDGGATPDMEPYKERLSDQEIWHLVNYIQGLREKSGQRR